MAIDIYWGSGSPYAWRVLLALEYKRVPYRSHLLQFSKQEHKSPQMLRLNPRGRVPVLKDGEHDIIDSVAICQYLADKHGKLTFAAGTIQRAHQDSFTQFAVDDVEHVDARGAHQADEHGFAALAQAGQRRVE